MSYKMATSLLHVVYQDYSTFETLKFEGTNAIVVEYIRTEWYWNVSKDSLEFLVLFDFQHVWWKSGHFERAVNNIDTLDSTYRGMV